MRQFKSLRRQRGIFDIGGSATVGSTKSSGTEATTGSSVTSSTGKRRTLDVETESQLKDLVGALLSERAEGGDQEDRLNELGELLIGRAKTAQADIRGDIDSIVAAERAEGEREISRINTQLAQLAGGTKGNSFVAGATAREQGSLAVRLAGIAGELGLGGRAQQTEEFANAASILRTAAEAGQSETNAIAQIASILKGSTDVFSGTDRTTFDQTTLKTGKTKSKEFSANASFGI